MQRLLSGLLVSMVLTGTALAADEESIWRLFVADHTAPTVTAIDLRSRELVGTFPLIGPASLYAPERLEKVGEIGTGGLPYNIVAVGGSGRSHD